MDLKEIITEAMQVSGGIGQDVTAIAYDSRSIKGGEVFVASRGERLDGHCFIADALERGAAAIVFDGKEEERVASFRESHPHVAWIPVSDPRDAMALFSSRFYRDPSAELTLIGITGTNGKTTTSYLVKAILEEWRKTVGLIGTISYLIKEKAYEAPHTTPEAPDFQSLLRRMADEGCGFVVAEVSSHSLVQKRVEHAHFSVAVFTNLTRDHLDYHQTMEAYFHAKERLFTHLLDPRGAAVINSDDSYGRMLAEKLRGMGRRVITSSAEGRETELQALDVKISFTGTAFTLRYNDDDHVMRSPLLGMKNMENILSAVGVALALEIPFEVIRRAIESFRAVKGRFERVDLGQRFLAVVDYAHTGDALDGLLRMSRDLLGACNSEGRGRLITVFGCGGNRDKGKRPEMGRIASDMSDTVIVTSDNPRDEDPLEIIKEIEAGMEGKEHIVIPERASAIRKAVELASAGDMVVIAGKGHEDYQEIRGERYHFSDRETLEDAIRECLQICAGREE